MEWYDKAIKIDPDYVSAYVSKGSILEILGKYKEAITWYDKAIKIDPDYVSAHDGKRKVQRSLDKNESR